MPRTDFHRMNCSIARAIDILAEPWTPLILRDLLLGISRFDDIRTDLGVSTNILTDRLRRLEEHGVVKRRRYGGHSRRFEYLLTSKGEDAVPILLELLAWGDRWEAGRAGPPTEVVHTACGEPVSAVAHCSVCRGKLELDELEYRNGPGSRRGPGTEVLRRRLSPRRTRR